MPEMTVSMSQNLLYFVYYLYLCLPVSNEHYCLTEYSVYHLIYRKTQS